jgi:hypothetical protein
MLETKQLVSSRLKTAAVLFGSLIFVAIAAFLPANAGESNQWRWWGGAFFGLGAVTFSWLLIRPQQLILDPEGFTVRGGLVRSPKRIAWRSIDPFFLYQLPRGGKMIAYNFRPGAGPDPTLLRKLNRRLGADGSLPRLWPGSPSRFVEELNAYREQALKRFEN